MASIKPVAKTKITDTILKYIYETQFFNKPTKLGSLKVLKPRNNKNKKLISHHLSVILNICNAQTIQEKIN